MENEENTDEFDLLKSMEDEASEIDKFLGTGDGDAEDDLAKSIPAGSETAGKTTIPNTSESSLLQKGGEFDEKGFIAAMKKKGKKSITAMVKAMYGDDEEEEDEDDLEKSLIFASNNDGTDGMESFHDEESGDHYINAGPILLKSYQQSKKSIADLRDEVDQTREEIESQTDLIKSLGKTVLNMSKMIRSIAGQPVGTVSDQSISSDTRENLLKSEGNKGKEKDPLLGLKYKVARTELLKSMKAGEIGREHILAFEQQGHLTDEAEVILSKVAGAILPKVAGVSK